MLSLGCIQSLECNKNICPTGVATQKPELMRGLVVADKKQRVANFHGETIKAFREFMAATGLRHSDEINRVHLNRNEGETLIARYDESYPYLPTGSLLKAPFPDGWAKMMSEAHPSTFARQVQAAV